MRPTNKPRFVKPNYLRESLDGFASLQPSFRQDLSSSRMGKQTPTASEREVVSMGV